MVSPRAQTPISPPGFRNPTDCLTKIKTEHLSQLNIFLLVKDGFALQDVRAMVSISQLYASSKVIDRILGKSKLHKTDDGALRLNNPADTWQVWFLSPWWITHLDLEQLKTT